MPQGLHLDNLFDMSQDMMITPKRINYAREKEQQLYESLVSIAIKKQEEIRHMINDTINNMRTDLLQELDHFKSPFVDYNVNTSSSFPSSSLRYKSHFVYTLGFIISFCWSLTLSEAKGTAVIGASGGGSDGGKKSCSLSFYAFVVLSFSKDLKGMFCFSSLDSFFQ